MEKKHKARPVSLGIAVGKVLKFSRKKLDITRYNLQPEEIENEIIRFNNAVLKSYRQINEIKNRIQSSAGDEYAKIFDAHLLLLQDKFFINEVIERITNERTNSEYVLNEVIDIITKSFNNLDSELTRQRAIDIVDVGRRMLQNLQDIEENNIDNESGNYIIVADDLFPSDTLHLLKKNVLGFITERGGVTSHTAILARAMRIPAIVDAAEALDKFIDEELIILDAFSGVIIQNPEEETLKKYLIRKADYFETEKKLLEKALDKCITTDGKCITFFANIEIPDEIPNVSKYGVEGIGLFRTEFIFIDKVRFPSENEQYMTYRRAIEDLPAGMPLVIRTIDIGGDKLFLTNKKVQGEANPFLGLRGIRFCLQNRDIFKTQLRAILRASAFGNIQLLIPMVSFVVEIIKTKEIIEEIKNELKIEEIHFNNAMKIGVMIEVPGAALVVDEFLKFVDFVSIGTNDLIQYTLAVDRGNDKVSHLFQRFHPAVMQLIKHTIDTCRKYNKDVAVCGDMAEIPSAAIILLGMGLTEFSMTPSSVPDIKMILSKISSEQAAKFTKDIIKLHLTVDVKKYITENIKPLITSILPSYSEADEWLF